MLNNFRKQPVPHLRISLVLHPSIINTVHIALHIVSLSHICNKYGEYTIQASVVIDNVFCMLWHPRKSQVLFCLVHFNGICKFSKSKLKIEINSLIKKIYTNRILLVTTCIHMRQRIREQERRQSAWKWCSPLKIICAIEPQNAS